MSVNPMFSRQIAGEGLGTALLVLAVVGSGCMAEHLADGNPALALLANTLATGGALVALIFTFAPISGAQFNPIVTLSRWASGEISLFNLVGTIGAQCLGGLAGVAMANAMFHLPLWSASTQVRTGGEQWLGEFLATFGLLGVILSASRHRPTATPWAVAGWIVGAYWFTASTSFANPAVTLARAFTDSFAGIRPWDVPGFVLAQLLGAACAFGVFRWLLRDVPSESHPG